MVWQYVSIQFRVSVVLHSEDYADNKNIFPISMLHFTQVSHKQKDAIDSQFLFSSKPKFLGSHVQETTHGVNMWRTLRHVADSFDHDQTHKVNVITQNRGRIVPQRTS